MSSKTVSKSFVINGTKITEADLDHTRVDTMRHIANVQQIMLKIAQEIIQRSTTHDASKLESPEIEYFALADKMRPTGDIQYDSPEYKASLEALQPALEHHYSKNRHHPQHFKHGVDDMNLIDLIEMFCDWEASSARYKGGNIRLSIEANAKRFGINPQLVKIFENSIDLLKR